MIAASQLVGAATAANLALKRNVAVRIALSPTGFILTANRLPMCGRSISRLVPYDDVAQAKAAVLVLAVEEIVDTMLSEAETADSHVRPSLPADA